MSFAFSYPIIFCAYRLSTSMPLDNRCALPGIKFRKTFWINSDLSCFSVIIFSRKKRCIIWPFKLRSDLFLLVNNIRNWRILRLQVRNCNLIASCSCAHLSGDCEDQVQTIWQMSSVWWWEAVQRVLKATFKVFCIWRLCLRLWIEALACTAGMRVHITFIAVSLVL